MGKNKVVFISHVDSLGGAETVLSEAIDSVIKDNQDILIIVNRKGNGDFYKKYKGKVKIKRMYFGLIYKNNFKTMIELPFLLLSIIRLIIIIKINRVSLIYSNTSVNILGAIVAKLSKCNHIWHIHEQKNGFFNPNYTWMYNWLMKSYRNINVFISKEICEEWNNDILIHKSLIIGNPIKKSINISEDPIITLEKNKEYIVLGFAGSIVNNKNLILILKALKEINTNKLKLIIAGDGPLMGEMKEFCSNNNLSDKVVFLGKIDNMMRFYNSIDILVLPSFTEGVPLVVLEAAINKKLILLTENSKMDTVLVKGEDYISINPNDHTQLQFILQNILQNKEKYYLYINNCYDKVKFYLESNNFEKLIKEIIKYRCNKNEY